MMQCAQNGEECDVGEMMDMIDELERLNMECEGALSRECSLQAVEARNILKVALASQAAAEDAILRAGKRNGLILIASCALFSFFKLPIVSCQCIMRDFPR